MKRALYFLRMVLFLVFFALLIATAYATEEVGETSGNTFSSDPKPYNGPPPTELIGTWSGIWDNPSSTIAELTIDKVTPDVSGKYKSSATRETGPGEFKFSAPLQEKSGKCCFTVVSPNSGRSMLFTFNNGKLRGEWRLNSVEMKRK